MPWQPSGNGRSGWSTKLIRGLKAEAAAGFQSRRERCREPTPVTPQYAAFTTYKQLCCWPQADLGCQATLSRSIALRVVIILRMTATMMTLGFLLVAARRW